MVLFVLLIIAVAGPLDKKQNGKDCSCLVFEVPLLPPTSASTGEAERLIKNGLSSSEKSKKV